MIPQQAIDAFYRGERSAAVRFVINDPVRITVGPHAGRQGCIVSLASAGQEPHYLVELGSAPYETVEASESALLLLE